MTAASVTIAGCSGGSGDRVASVRPTTTATSASPTTEATLPETVTPPTTAPIETPAQYLGYAIDLVRDNAYYGGRVDWSAVRAEAFHRARGATEFEHTYDAIAYVLGELGDRHSRLATPVDVEQSAPGILPTGVPEATKMTAEVTMLRLPMVAGPSESPGIHRYVEAADRAVASHRRSCGWIVDLRGNPGGNLIPMLSAVGPLLQRDDAISIRNGQGQVQRFTYRDGRVRFDDKLAPGPKNAQPPLSPPPAVALLTDAETASSAEFVALAFRGQDRARSFGATTAGLPTANDSFRLPDGAVVILTIAVGQDATGRLWEGPIPAEHPTAPGDAQQAATRWLQDRCR